MSDLQHTMRQIFFCDPQDFSNTFIILPPPPYLLTRKKGNFFRNVVNFTCMVMSGKQEVVSSFVHSNNKQISKKIQTMPIYSYIIHTHIHTHTVLASTNLWEHLE